jgi:hypothetical protein
MPVEFAELHTKLLATGGSIVPDDQRAAETMADQIVMACAPPRCAVGSRRKTDPFRKIYALND